ncbi:MAG: translation initiation factor eIF-1A [Promethearchaeota archaeon]
MPNKKQTRGKKRKSNFGTNEGQVIRAKKPRRQDGEVMALVTQILGDGRMMVQCDDEKRRMARIRGKNRRRMWTRVGDIVIVSPWDFQDEKCDIMYRYNKREVSWLERNGHLSPFLEF